MTSRRLELEHDDPPPGEYRFAPDELSLAFCPREIELEQVDDVRLWPGTCLRDDVGEPRLHLGLRVERAFRAGGGRTRR